MMRRCATCWHYAAIENGEGFCHRYPPTLRTEEGKVVGNVCVPVGENQWCGEWWFDFGKFWRGFKWDPARSG